MLISLIKQTSPGRLTVCLDGGEDIRTTLGVVTDMRLYNGLELDDAALDALRQASSRAIARERAMEYLSSRPMSCMELRSKLIEKGESEETADYCVQWLRDNGLIDDASYAAAVARHYSAKGYGEGRVRAELRRRGIDRELWDDALGSMPQPDDKLDRFIASRLKDPSDRDQIRKIGAALYRRGYSWDEIRHALARYDADPED